VPFITQGKTNIKYILIVVILAAIAGGGILGYYYLWIKDLETRLTVVELKMPEKIVKDETANWKIYTDSDYKISFKYPTDWEPKEFFKNTLPLEPCNNYLGPNSSSSTGFCISSYARLKPDEAAEAALEADKSIKLVSRTSIKVDGKDSIKQIVSKNENFIYQAFVYPWIPNLNHFSPCSGMIGSCDPKSPTTVMFIAQDLDNVYSKDQFEKIFDEILSTIVFTADETTDWKTYFNPQDDFTFKYPQDWEIKYSYIYKTPAESKAKRSTVTLGKMGDKDYGMLSELESEWIFINSRQFPCTIEPCKCNHVEDLEVAICTEDLERLGIFKKLTSSVQIAEEFCGSSTNGNCVANSDCITGGCSGQVCQSKDEEGAITTCEWRDCYDEAQYGLECECVENKCQWSK
jgi:eight-cysteine-cluster-containing protein